MYICDNLNKRIKIMVEQWVLLFEKAYVKIVNFETQR